MDEDTKDRIVHRELELQSAYSRKEIPSVIAGMSLKTPVSFFKGDSEDEVEAAIKEWVRSMIYELQMHPEYGLADLERNFPS